MAKFLLINFDDSESCTYDSLADLNAELERQRTFPWTDDELESCQVFEIVREIPIKTKVYVDGTE